MKSKDVCSAYLGGCEGHTGELGRHIGKLYEGTNTPVSGKQMITLRC
jgi:hypothetical protein